MAECIFCSIATDSTPAEIIHATDEVVFFRDINPKATVHILGIPREHVGSFAEASSHILGVLMREAQVAAEKVTLSSGGYRLIINNGSDAGQEVHHLHVHVLGGESLGPLRC